MPRLGFYEFYEFLCKNGFKWVIIGLLGLTNGFWVGLGYRGRNPKPNGLGFGSDTPTQNGFCRSLITIRGAT